MGALAVYFWFIVALYAELAGVALAVQASALALLLILSFAGLALVAELDALAVLLLGAYTGVFLFLALLALHFGPYHQAAQSSRARGARAGALPWGASLALGVGASLASAPGGGAPWLSLSQDLLGSGWAGPTLSAEVLHWLFFRLCLGETILLNLYLLAGLAAAVALLTALQGAARQPVGASSLRATTEGGPASTRRLRALTQQRRQARRRNAGSVRQGLSNASQADASSRARHQRRGVASNASSLWRLAAAVI